MASSKVFPWPFSWGLALALLFAGRGATAQTAGFAIDRFEPAERGSDWFVGESLDLRGHLRPAVGLVGDWAYKPLVIYAPNGDERAAVIEHQVFAHVGGALVLWDRLRVGASLPLAVYQAGSAGTIANTRFDSSNATTVGDARLGADARLIGVYDDPVRLAAGLQLHVPTGSRDAFTGDGKVRLVPRLLGAATVARLELAGRLSFVYRAQDEQLGDLVTGSEVAFALAAGMRLADDRLLVGPELWGSTVVSHGGAAFALGTTPLEILFGAHYRVAPAWRVGAGVGPGLTRGAGAPTARVVASLEWFPPIEEPKPAGRPADRDGDGVLDADDACVDVPGVATDDPETNGCPPPGPSDQDGDGILDDDDACPTAPGPKSTDPKKHGCPPRDRDGDRVLDDDDACPDTPGERSDDPAKNGCPKPKDGDGDGIIDAEDACPDVPGPANADPKKNGCPKARVERGQIRILERVEFATASSKLLPESQAVLEAVLEVMKEHPEFTKLSVEGHTDNRGGAGYNRTLSKARAAAVVKWLVARGIDAGRLSSAGLGMDRPLDSNDTSEGRQNNRRVEFHIREIDGKATKDTTTVQD